MHFSNGAHSQPEKVVIFKDVALFSSLHPFHIVGFDWLVMPTKESDDRSSPIYACDCIDYAEGLC
jgi:hypothetical protein